MQQHTMPGFAEPTPAASTDAAIASRMSVRAFTPRAVAPGLVAQMLADATASLADAGNPPCTIHVLQGQSRSNLCDRICTLHDAIRADPALLAAHCAPYDYYPERWSSPYIERRRENGWGLYGLLGIGRADKDRMHAQHQRNYRYFDAPVGLVFTMDRSLGSEHLLACGRFLQAIMVQARLQGLHTCPQAAWNMFAGVILAHVGASVDEALVCSMALGYADPGAIVNGYRTPRLPVAAFARAMG